MPPARLLPMAFRADAARLALGTPGRDLVLWDTSSPRRPVQVGALRRGGGIVAAAWNPAAVALLATVSADGSVAAWRIPDDRPPQLTATMSVPRERPQRLAWLAGGKQLFGATALGRTAVWDADGTPRAYRERTIKGLVLAAYGWDGAAAIVSHAGHIELWDPATRLAKGRVLPARVVAAAHSGELLAVAGADGQIAIIDRDLERLAVLRHPSLAPMLLAFAEDGQALVLAAADGSLAVVGPDHSFRWHRPGGGVAPAGVAVAAGLVAVLGHDGSATLLRLPDGAPA